MNQVIFLFLRRMRAPLLVLIFTYAISILGLVLIPGVDDHGQPWHMDFFHAFYFVSYMASTIGFGELPYAFTAAQRMWVLVSIYMTVIAWLYAIGKILTLMQDPAFKQSVTEGTFARGVRLIREPFYIVCGYGDTGSLLVRALVHREIRAVVIDLNPDRINELSLEDLHLHVPGLCADASASDHLLEAGLNHPCCAGVVALTDSDEDNLKIAITTKLLNPTLTVICRAEHGEVESNMASFGTDHITNPYEAFADRLALALHAPGMHLLHEWLTGVPDTPLAQPLYPPHGTWVLCGYGRFGKAVRHYLGQEGVETVIVEADPEGTDCVGACVVGQGTEAVTLEEANIHEAVGIVAGTDNDTNNLSIIMTARELNPQLFMVGRQNKRHNHAIFEAARLDLVMQRSEIIARKIFAQLTTPLLPRFLEKMRAYRNDWANQLVSRISAVTGEKVPAVWNVDIDEKSAPAVLALTSEGIEIRLQDLVKNPRDREADLACVPLLLCRGDKEIVTPEYSEVVRPGDRVLFCGRVGVHERMMWTLLNQNALRYVRTGVERPDGYIWRWLSRRRTARS